MAITNYERVGKALDLLKDGLRPFVERELKAQLPPGVVRGVQADPASAAAELLP